MLRLKNSLKLLIKIAFKTSIDFSRLIWNNKLNKSLFLGQGGNNGDNQGAESGQGGNGGDGSQGEGGQGGNGGDGGQGGNGGQGGSGGQGGESGQGGNDECTAEGFYPVTGDCKKFYRCVDNGKGGFTKYEFDCADGTLFDPELNTCNHERDVHRDCNSTQQSTTASSASEGTTTAAPTSEEGNTKSPEETTTASGTTAATTSSSSESTTASSGSSEGTTQAQESSSQGSTTAAPPNCTPVDPKPAEVNCTQAGYYPDSSDCANFYRCVDWDEDKGERFSVYFFRCPNGTIYDPEINTCNHPENIQPPRECGGQTTEPATEGTTEQSQETTTAGGTTEGTSTTASSETTAPPPAEQQQTTTEGQQQETTTENTAGTTTGSTAAPQETTPAEESTKSPEEGGTTTESGNQSTDAPAGEAQSECDNLQPGQYAYVCPTGFRRHPRYCNRFYQCTQKDENDVNVLVLNCPENTVFDNNQQQCLPAGKNTLIEGNLINYYLQNLMNVLIN
jgi:hypothetical protein